MRNGYLDKTINAIKAMKIGWEYRRHGKKSENGTTFCGALKIRTTL